MTTEKPIPTCGRCTNFFMIYSDLAFGACHLIRKSHSRRILDPCIIDSFKPSMGYRVRAFCKTDDEARTWFKSPQPGLDGDTPMERIEKGDREAVERIIEQLEVVAEYIKGSTS